MPLGNEINPEVLKRICWLNGLTVTALSRRIKKSWMSVYRSVKDPARYPVTYDRVRRTLKKRELEKEVKNV